jgi:hypothetical protein
MLTPFARALAYYLGGGFALGLFCGMWYLGRPVDLDPASQRLLHRRILVLSPLGLLHPVVALAAFGMARDATRHGDPVAGRRPMVLATASLTVSTAITAGVLLTA